MPPLTHDPQDEASNIQDFLHGLPKVELHCHLLGTVQQSTLLEWARREKSQLSQADIEAFYVRGEKPVGVLRVLRALEQELLKTPADLYRLTIEYLQAAVSHRVRYAEFFWNPTGCARDAHIAYGPAVDAMSQAITDAQRQWGIEGRIIPSIDREASPDAALEMVGWMKAHRHDCVVGMGIDYNEVAHPPEWFEASYAQAREAGFKTTAHAGEFGTPWTHVQTAVEVLKVDRVDHGYTLIERPELARRYAEQGLIFTVVPTNTYYLRTLPADRWALDHPIRQMPALGFRIHPNTDDPTLHQVNPTLTWWMMMRDFGFQLDDLRQFMLNGIDGAWVDASVQSQWRQSFSSYFDEHRPDVPIQRA